MRHKSKLVLMLAVGLPFLFGAFSYRKSAGAHPGSTGAPLDNTCAKSGCHVGTPVTYNDTTVNKLIFSQPDSTYVPGMTYTITLKTQNPGVMRFGFELQALEDSTNKDIGTIVITDAARSHTLTHTVSGGVRTSATHSTSGTTALSPGFNEWTFNWTAPPVNEGVITFYYATNSTNNSNTSSGDAIFINTFKIRPYISNGISEFIDEQSINAFYDTESNQIILNYNLKAEKNVAIKVHDAMGRDLIRHSNRNRSAGQQKEELAFRNTPSGGIYYISITAGGKSVTKKVLITK